MVRGAATAGRRGHLRAAAGPRRGRGATRWRRCRHGSHQRGARLDETRLTQAPQRSSADAGCCFGGGVVGEVQLTQVPGLEEPIVGQRLQDRSVTVAEGLCDPGQLRLGHSPPSAFGAQVPQRGGIPTFWPPTRPRNVLTRQDSQGCLDAIGPANRPRGRLTRRVRCRGTVGPLCCLDPLFAPRLGRGCWWVVVHGVLLRRPVGALEAGLVAAWLLRRSAKPASTASRGWP